VLVLKLGDYFIFVRIIILRHITAASGDNFRRLAGFDYLLGPQIVPCLEILMGFCACRSPDPVVGFHSDRAWTVFRLVVVDRHNIPHYRNICRHQAASSRSSRLRARRVVHRRIYRHRYDNTETFSKTDKQNICAIVSHS